MSAKSGQQNAGPSLPRRRGRAGGRRTPKRHELVLTAHFHHYERFADLDATGQPPAPGAAGTREIIAGIGGESQGSFTGLTSAPGSQVRLAGYGILAVALGSGSYSWQYRQIGGATADSGTEACHA